MWKWSQQFEFCRHVLHTALMAEHGRYGALAVLSGQKHYLTNPNLTTSISKKPLKSAEPVKWKWSWCRSLGLCGHRGCSCKFYAVFYGRHGPVRRVGGSPRGRLNGTRPPSMTWSARMKRNEIQDNTSRQSKRTVDEVEGPSFWIIIRDHFSNQKIDRRNSFC